MADAPSYESSASGPSPSSTRSPASKVLVTGASTGIGRAIALAWAARGATVVLSARSESALADVGRDVEIAGGRPIIVPGDVTDESYCEDLVARAARDAEGIDILINNAGRGFYAPFDKIDIPRMRELFELNVFAPLRLAQLATPHLVRSRGTVVMMSSVAGVVAAPRYAAYAASKFALEAMAMSMRAELADKGVRVTVVRPGPVATPFRTNATKAEGVPGYDKPDPRSQSADFVAELTLRAVDRGAPVLETSSFVRVASAAQRLVPGPLRMVMRRMAQKHPEG